MHTSLGVFFFNKKKSQWKDVMGSECQIQFDFLHDDLKELVRKYMQKRRVAAVVRAVYSGSVCN